MGSQEKWVIEIDPEDFPILRMIREGEATLEKWAADMRLPAELLGPADAATERVRLYRHALPLVFPPDNRTPQQHGADEEKFRQQLAELHRRLWAL